MRKTKGKRMKGLVDERMRGPDVHIKSQKRPRTTTTKKA